MRNQKPAVFILNELFMNENTGYIPENGKLKLSLRLFLKKDSGRYSEILAIDSIFIVKGFDVTKKLFRSVSEEFCAIAKLAAESKSTDDKPTFTRDELNDLDSLEISRIPIFSNQIIVASSISSSSNKSYLFRFKINYRQGNSIPIGVAE